MARDQESWATQGLNLQRTIVKRRHPKSAGIRYFKINKQFRAKAVFVGSVLSVISIDNHQ
ncbi:MAG: hypothetical protein ACJAZ9_001949 [Neolewinella sp.]|jgi:hypothetical protein